MTNDHNTHNGIKNDFIFILIGSDDAIIVDVNSWLKKTYILIFYTHQQSTDMMPNERQMHLKFALK